MKEIILTAEPRAELGKTKVKMLRRTGFIPGVIYAEGKKSESVKLVRREFIHLLHEQRLDNAIITLKVKGAEKETGRPCMIKDTQLDPVNDEIRHIDFLEISLTKKLKVKVPIEVKGEPSGVKQEGGSLERILWEIEIECLPTEIPVNIPVEVTNLKIGDSIHVKDLTFSGNIKVLQDMDAIVLSVAAPMKEEVAPAEGEEKTEPEVIKEKKETPEEAAAKESEKK
ncbi:MAG: 50S ribosomal protein L25 [Candidatus Omnitrophica bacterium]|nr:50S ribosomal protein L25 [Candidatus Omnitrophota bacterium]